jgi:Arc/MetJ-type ribon-helix-helix transcriptional regulator
MIKTQVQLEEWQYRAAKLESTRSSRSLSDIVREGLTLALQRSARRPAQALEELAGKYSPQSFADLKGHDRAWAEAIR